MAIDLVTQPGGLFPRLGRIGGIINAVNSFRGNADLSAAGIVSLSVGVENLKNQFLSVNTELIDSLYSLKQTYIDVHSSWLSSLQRLAEDVVKQMVYDDMAIPNLTLEGALKEVIKQCISAGKTVLAPSVSSNIVVGAENFGNATLLISTQRPDGKIMEYVYNEPINIICFLDAQSGGTAVNSEGWTVIAKDSTFNHLNFIWPNEVGSGTNTTTTTVSPDSTILDNGNMDSWTESVPDSWTVLTGIPNTHISSAGQIDAYRGTNALKIIGDGVTLTALAQKVSIAPLTAYAVYCRAKLASSVASGELRLSLVDSLGNVIQNQAGQNQELVIDLTTLSTSYSVIGGYFQTPIVLPPNVYFRIKLSQALPDGKALFLDDLVLVLPKTTYSSGPYYTIIAGNIPAKTFDRFTMNIINNYESKWQVLLSRIFPLHTLGLQFPSSTSPNIPDSWIS